MARSLNVDGCEFGRRYTLEFNMFKQDVTQKLDDVLKNQKELFNHQSDRVKPEDVAELLKAKDALKARDQILTGIVVAAIVFLLTTFLGKFF